jgi:hypothetical protein
MVSPAVIELDYFAIKKYIKALMDGNYKACNNKTVG